ncbi:hypothetical protein BUALT_Bualt01G0244900 [Buddleja alternifolia]|uniref:Transmembrane protein 230 n=1 Tax=Buddleja alternifolia TaxID=168488 RepID=A0AAV6YK79_9LAMI|nr:hypothetical protein BUALT_Bualt01G0244900 [Buddleja alternifolia]
MASYQDVKEEKYRRFQGMVKTWIGCLGSFTLSLLGGLILAWWELNYHPTNEQQWMVPVGLILFVTPLTVSLSLFISDFYLSSTHDYSPSEKPFHDPEKLDTTR